MNDPTVPEPTTANPPGTEPVPHADAPLVQPSPAPEYEFTEPQNQVIDDLVRGILWVRVPLFIVAIFQLAMAIGLAFRLQRDGAHIVSILGSILIGVVCFVLARWLTRAAVALNLVTTTRGRDISNLMVGIGNLAISFDLLAFFVKIYLFLLAILVILLGIGLFTGSFRGPS